MMKKPFSLLLILSSLLFTACQKEEYEVITDQDQNSISVNSEVYDLVLRTTMFDGSVDDEIDGSPCFSIEFPYTVIVDGEEFNINSEAALNEFLAGLPQDVETEDIALNFPVRVKNTGHQTVTVVNIQQLRGLQQSCRNSQAGNRGPITCARFSFPLRLTSYNSASQQTGAAVLNSQEELFEYLNNTSSNTVVSFEYPLQIISNGVEIRIPNQNRLRELLRECEE